MMVPAPVMRLLFPLSFNRRFSHWMNLISYVAGQETYYAIWLREYTRTYREVIR